MNKILKQVTKIVEKVLKEKFNDLNDLEIPKKQGIYLIKEKSGRFFNNKIFYVGKSTNLRNRIIRQHSSKRDSVAGSMLRIKLNRKGLKYSQIQNYLTKECLFIIQEIEDFDINSLVENLLIAIFREKEELINEIKGK